MVKTKEKRSNKWAFILYADSAPKNYRSVLDSLHIPYILSPWHDKDVNKETGVILKPHKHGALFFDSLKSSPKGMYDYFTHAENSDKTQYNIEDIESGCGFDLEKFLIDNNSGLFLTTVIDIITENDFTEFEDLVEYARFSDRALLGLIIERTYFFTKFLDSRRHNPERNKIKNE